MVGGYLKAIFKVFKYSSILLLLVFFAFTSCFQFRTTNSKTLKKLKKAGITAKAETKQYAGLKLNYIQTGEDSSHCVVFVHGAPGANDAFVDYLHDSALLQKATLVAIDRPGYGYSDRKKNFYSLQEQSNCIGALLKELKGKYKHLVLVGHSYGATMVAKLAMDYNAIIDATIQISGAVDPDNEKMFWFSKAANSPLVFWSLSKTLKVTTKEKVNHADDLRAAMRGWDSITKQYVVIHGDKDQLVPYINFNYTKNKLQNTQAKMISVKDGGHLLIWDAYKLVRDEILLMLN